MISGPAFNEAVERFKSLKDFGIQELNFSCVPLVRIKNLARYAGMTSIYKIRKMPDEKRIALLISFVKVFEINALDEALDVFDLLITDIAGEAVFWRIDKDADYGVLNEVARGVVKTRRIEQYWENMMRIAGSLKLGTVQASELIYSLLRSNRPSSLSQAIIDAGRINKTLYLLNYIDDEEYRRRILIQLNRGEERHGLARVICHGQRGEIRKRYLEGQEDQLGSLGLVTNAVVLWNTIYMEASLEHLRQQYYDVKKEDETRLSPLLYHHINMLGHCR